MFIALGSLGVGATVMFVGAKEFNWLGLGQKTKTAVTEAIPQALKSALGANENQTDNEVITIAKNLKQTVTDLEEKVTNLAGQLQTKNTETFEDNSEELTRPIFLHTSNEEDFQQYLTKATQESDAEAQYEVGRHYAMGWGITKDEDIAVEWYKKAATHAEHPNAKAQYSLGHCYRYERGVDEDLEKAVEWYRKAATHAEHPNAGAQYQLGDMYYDSGFLEEAVEWYRKAATHAEHPNADAQYQLGRCYYNGWGVTQNTEEAKQWYVKAAANGRDIPRKLKQELGI
jgi:TPR repeat protein